MNLERLERLKELNWRRALSLQLEIRPALRGTPYWVAAVLVAFVAVVYSGAFGLCITYAQTVARQYPYYMFALSPACFMLGAWLVKRFAPAAGGTGTPQVALALKLDFAASPREIDDLLNLKVAAIIISSSLLAVLGGGALGREGPMVHIAACIFYFAGRLFSLIWPYQEHRSWIVAGGAAGVAAAFNTPLAGIVFVLEELAAQHFHQFKTVIFSAVIIAGMVAQWISGRYLFLGYPRVDAVGFSSVFWAALVGAVCGLGAGMFERILAWMRPIMGRVRARGTLLVAALSGLIMAALTALVDYRIAGGGIALIQELLFQGGQVSWWVLLGRFFGTMISHLSGCAGGFLAPGLSLGAAIGSKLSQILSPSHHTLMVMVGMAGFLSALLRSPFTALIIVMEMTDRHSAIFALMLSSLISFAVVRWMAPEPE